MELPLFGAGALRYLGLQAAQNQSKTKSRRILSKVA
jgi:hypothetical protein